MVSSNIGFILKLLYYIYKQNYKHTHTYERGRG